VTLIDAETLIDADYQPPLTRQERAENVRKRNYFNRYGEKTRAVMKAILNQDSTAGIEAIESSQALKVSPFTHIGTPVEIIQAFGGRSQFQAALHDLEEQIYRVA
jgi:type I restriction enzyme, R subunit